MIKGDILEKLKDHGRVSAEDLAIAVGQEFGGAEGIAKIWRMLLTSAGTQAATKARIVGNIQQLMENTSKLYGDRAKLAGMDKAQLEKRIVELLVKHKLVIPIAGMQHESGSQPIQVEQAASQSATKEDPQPGTRQGENGVG